MPMVKSGSRSAEARCETDIRLHLRSLGTSLCETTNHPVAVLRMKTISSPSKRSLFAATIQDWPSRSIAKGSRQIDGGRRLELQTLPSGDCSNCSRRYDGFSLMLYQISPGTNERLTTTRVPSRSLTSSRHVCWSNAGGAAQPAFRNAAHVTIASLKRCAFIPVSNDLLDRSLNFPGLSAL